VSVDPPRCPHCDGWACDNACLSEWTAWKHDTDALIGFLTTEGDFRRFELADTRAALRLAETELVRLRNDLARALAVLT
jgi:hypothetical protein